MLAAGLEGIEKNYSPVPMAELSVTQMTESERKARDIKPLPGSLYEDPLHHARLVEPPLPEHLQSRFVGADSQHRPTGKDRDGI